MLRTALVALLVLHGLIHGLGVAKAFGWAEVSALTKTIGRPLGVVWGMAGALFVLAAVLLLMRSEKWWVVAAVALLCSQVLIALHWHDARFGTVANLLVLLAVIVGAASWNFKRHYTRAVDRTVEATAALPAHRITEADLVALPTCVQHYLRTAGVVGTLEPRNMRITFQGSIRSEGGPWMPFTTVQVNRFDVPARFFWMDATMKGLPTKGLHAYEDGHATMLIKLAGLVPVMNMKGPEMDTAETVTWFNDLCLFAPGALLDPRITWSAVEERSAQATFSHGGITIHATLLFDAQHRLVDFFSDDRYVVAPPAAPQKRRFSTPMRDHRTIDGRLVPGYGETIWQLPSGPFTYGRFTLRSIAYDVSF
ncbi:MAG: hypothetical protein IPN85_18140 [Flavobacteriales bacterium]|nr:hypothetical protein [Flavobacteriales bacterium]